jgi:transposase InsO family protein
MCELARVPRSTYYRHWAEEAPAEEETEVRDAIQRIAMEHRRYGYRRVSAALRLNLGLVINHKRVARIMREDNLLAVSRRRFVVTTDSRHGFAVYANLVRNLTVTRINQLWVSDITYLRLGSEFVYLAVVLDVYSRRVVGWELGRSLQATLAISALERAYQARRPAPGWIHHSDQGVQYACPGYAEKLDEYGAIPSMSRRANPYDNAYAETFMKTLKAEEIECRCYSTLEELREHLAEFIDRYYNTQRLHSALGYLPPAAFEQARAAAAGAVLAVPAVPMDANIVSDNKVSDVRASGMEVFS